MPLGFAIVTSALMSLPRLTVYDDDTHYYFTYCVALTCGYNNEQARRIASANLMIDYCKWTEPLHFETTPFGANSMVWGNRVKFHSLSGNATDVLEQLTNLYKDAIRLRNPGVYLHAFQDGFSHAGFGPALGHMNPLLAPFGHTTDYISLTRFSGSRDQDMALMTAEGLVKYMNTMQSRQKPTASSFYRSRTLEFLDTIQRANPEPSRYKRPDISKVKKLLLSERKLDPPLMYEYNLKPNSYSGAEPVNTSVNFFPIWRPGFCGISFTENLAGIRPGRVYMDIKYESELEDRDQDGYSDFARESTEDSIPLDLGLVPVGSIKVKYKGKGVDFTRRFGENYEVMRTGILKMVPPVHFDKFKMNVKSGSKISGANCDVMSLSVQSDIENSFPRGNLVSSIRIKEKDNKTRTLTFGPFLGKNGCIFQSLGWDGFSASECWVEDNRGSKLKGSYSVSIKPNGSGIINFRAVGKDAKGKAISFAGSGIKFGKDDLISSTIPDYTRG